MAKLSGQIALAKHLRLLVRKSAILQELINKWYQVGMEQERVHRVVIFVIMGGLHHLPPKFEKIFVTIITFSSFVLCRYFCY